MRDGDGGDAATVGLRGVHAEAAPAGADLEHAVEGEDVEAAAAAGATAATGSTNVALGMAIAAGVAGAVGQAAASKYNVEKPLLVSGLGNVRIEASQSNYFYYELTDKIKMSLLVCLLALLNFKFSKAKDVLVN